MLSAIAYITNFLDKDYRLYAVFATHVAGLCHSDGNFLLLFSKCFEFLISFFFTCC